LPAGAGRGRKAGRTLRGASRDESGNILVLFAIFVPIFIMACAIAIDVGYWWVNGKKAQVAADACALAAARELPANWNRGDCYFGGQDYVLENLPDQLGEHRGTDHLSTRVLSPYEGQSKYVEATVRLRVQTFFGGFVGLDWVDLTRRAVAEREEGDGDYAIYSHSGGCPEDGDGESLEFDGDTHWINGRVHSNGQYLIGNDDGDPPYEPFWAKKGTRVDCVSIQPHDSARFGGDGYSTGQTKPDTVTTQTWPAWWTPADFGWIDTLDASDSGCDVKGKSILIKEDSGNTSIVIDSPIGPQPQLVFPGNTITNAYTYCAWEKFTINRQNLVATMSALSPEILVDENNQTLTAKTGNAQGKVLFFTVPNINSSFDGTFAGNGNPVCSPNPSKELKLNGNSHKWTGSIFNPCGRVLVNVGGSSIGDEALTGTILGFQVRVNGENFFMIGKDSFGGSAELALVE
jgi:hypothetical protein